MSFKKIYYFIKLLPILINLYILILIGCIFIFGYFEDYSYIFFGHSIIIDLTLFLCSYNPKNKFVNRILTPILPKLDFCLWHRLLSLNLILILVCEYVNSKFHFSLLECYMANLAFITTSASLLYTLIWKIRHDYKKSRLK